MFIGLVCICLSAVLSTSVVAAQDTESLESKYTRKGADTCLKCHDEDYNNYPILPIFYGKHGNRNNPRSPMAQLQCEACHGPGRAHATEPKAGQKRAPIIVFGKESWVSKAQQNEMCMGCHNRSTHMNWVGSAHDNNDLLCVVAIKFSGPSSNATRYIQFDTEKCNAANVIIRTAVSPRHC